VATIVVEHRDRFARFGAEYVEASLAACGTRGVFMVEISPDPGWGTGIE
jgi:predicted site-specific integrase-resolvase